MITGADLFFWVFSFITVSSAIMVISSVNPVHAVFFLILAFVNSAGLFVIMGADFLAMILLIVYVGAVAVLFLFVVMMLNVDLGTLKRSISKNLPIGLTVTGIIFLELFVSYLIFINYSDSKIYNLVVKNPENISNTKALGNVLYTEFFYLFQLSGLILLLAMLGAIILTLRSRSNVKKQIIEQQITRNVNNSIDLVDIKPNQGV